jgi:sialic acid synthase SpsE
MNLHTIPDMAARFQVPIGLSDHTLGTEAPVAAVALGAQIIEKHFTMNKDDPGPDHAASLEPDELRSMVQGIRAVELARGTGEKKCQPCEKDTRDTARRSILLTKDVKKGEKLTQDMLVMKRPGTGLPPKAFAETVGKTINQDMSAGSVLTREMLL